MYRRNTSEWMYSFSNMSKWNYTFIQTFIGDNRETIPCHNYVYDRRQYDSTLVTQVRSFARATTKIFEPVFVHILLEIVGNNEPNDKYTFISSYLFSTKVLTLWLYLIIKLPFNFSDLFLYSSCFTCQLFVAAFEDGF